MNRTTYRRARLVDDENADILGMPLQLAILVLVAGLALAAIIAWFAMISNTQSVDKIELKDSSGNKVLSIEEGTVDLTITVFDGGDYLDGVRLKLSQCNAVFSNGEGNIDLTGKINKSPITITTDFPGSQCEVKITATNPEYEGQATFNLMVNGD
jgi:hypothetical protein